MAETAFGVTYDGPALAEGRMPVRDLAPALLALGNLFADASVVLYPDRKPVALNIQATQDGSFVVDLILEAERTWDQLVDMFSGDVLTALVNLKEVIIGGVGLFWLTKRLKGRRVQSQTASTVVPGHVRLELDDKTTVEVPSEVLTLYQNVRVRREARQVVEPVDRPGVERLEFRSDIEVTVAVTREDLPAFEVPESEEVPLLDSETAMMLSIASVAFTEGNKWRFSDGEITFYAALEDEAFLDRVDRAIESFRKGDLLRCRVRILQSRRGDSLQTEYTVVEVLEHIPTPTQLPLAGQDPST